MASFTSRIVILGIKLGGFKKIFSQNPINYQKLRKTDVKKVPKKFLKRFNISSDTILKTNITEITSKQNSNEKLLLFLHGGAFVSGPAQHHWDSIATIVKKTSTNCWLVDYPKAPEVDILEISKNIDAVYQKALEKFDANNITLIGDSVGGNLCLGLTQRLIKQKSKLPKQLILITPVLDASMTNSEIDTIDALDPMLNKVGILSAKQLSANGLDLKNEILSPIYGSFKEFPKTIFFIGGRDIMSADAKLAVDKMKSDNVDVEIIYESEMPHIWPLLPVMTEAKNAMNKIVKAVKLASLLLISSFLLHNCQPRPKKSKTIQEPKTTQEYNPLKRKWMLVKIDSVNRDTLIKYKAHIDLTNKTNLGYAYASCNSINFNYTTNKQNINFTNIISTEAYCKNADYIEVAIKKALSNSKEFKIESQFLNLITKSNDTIKCVAEDWD